MFLIKVAFKVNIFAKIQFRYVLNALSNAVVSNTELINYRYKTLHLAHI